jgi:HNH endonuclease
MNWTIIYKNLIDKAILEQRCKSTEIYYENHHIIPKHMGGDNSKDNLVLLTFREHILAHYILWRIYGREGDKLMYSIRNLQTEESQRLRVKLAVEANRNGGKGFQNWSGDKNPMKDSLKVKKAIESKRQKYNGNIMSSDVKKQWLPKIKKRMQEMSKDPNIQEKRSKTIKEINATLTPEEFALKYNNAGENNGNYGWIKGYYEVIDPDGNITKYENQEEIIKQLSLSQSFLIRNRNKGVCYTTPKKNAGKWNGWTFNYFKLPCPTTGRVQKEHKKHKSTKRQKK